MVVFRQKLEREGQYHPNTYHCGERVKRTSLSNHHERICTGACPCGSSDASQDWTTALILAPVGSIPSGGRVTYIREPLAAAHVLALVWFLAGVGADVDCESTSLDEALATSRRAALVRPFVGVDAVVPLQVRLAVEALQTGQFTACYGLVPSYEVCRRGFRRVDGRMGTHGGWEQTLLHDCQSHWKGRAVGSFSTSSISSISKGFWTLLLFLMLSIS